MTKDESKRIALIEKLADHMLAHGLIGSSLRPLAKAAGTSDRMLLYYFRDKEELLAATSQLIAARMTMMLAARQAPDLLDEETLIAHLIGVLGDDAYWPFMRLWLEMASRAAGGDNFFKQIGRALGQGFLLWAASQLAERDESEKARQAARVMRATEGWMFLRAIGLDDVNVLALRPTTNTTE
jgi:AcrR family transcriptional regulator